MASIKARKALRKVAFDWKKFWDENQGQIVGSLAGGLGTYGLSRLFGAGKGTAAALGLAAGGAGWYGGKKLWDDPNAQAKEQAAATAEENRRRAENELTVGAEDAEIADAEKMAAEAEREEAAEEKAFWNTQDRELSEAVNAEIDRDSKEDQAALEDERKRRETAFRVALLGAPVPREYATDADFVQAAATGARRNDGYRRIRKYLSRQGGGSQYLMDYLGGDTAENLLTKHPELAKELEAISFQDPGHALAIMPGAIGQYAGDNNLLKTLAKLQNNARSNFIRDDESAYNKDKQQIPSRVDAAIAELKAAGRKKAEDAWAAVLAKNPVPPMRKEQFIKGRMMSANRERQLRQELTQKFMQEAADAQKQRRTKLQYYTGK